MIVGEKHFALIAAFPIVPKYFQPYRGVKAFGDYCQEHFLVINDRKTKVAVFARKKTPKCKWTIKEKKIQWMKNFKYFCMLLQNIGPWMAHINYSHKPKKEQEPSHNSNKEQGLLQAAQKLFIAQPILNILQTTRDYTN